jgi:hypothetical protein
MHMQYVMYALATGDYGGDDEGEGPEGPTAQPAAEADPVVQATRGRGEFLYRLAATEPGRTRVMRRGADGTAEFTDGPPPLGSMIPTLSDGPFPDAEQVAGTFVFQFEGADTATQMDAMAAAFPLYVTGMTWRPTTGGQQVLYALCAAGYWESKARGILHPAESEADLAQLLAFNEAMNVAHLAGTLLASLGMSYPSQTRAMRRRGGVPEYVDGPVPARWLSPGHRLAAEYVIETMDPSRLEELAGLFPPQVLVVWRPVADAHKRADSHKAIVDLDNTWGGYQP